MINIDITQHGFSHYGLMYKVYFVKNNSKKMQYALISGQEQAEMFVDMLKSSGNYASVVLNKCTWETYCED